MPPITTEEENKEAQPIKPTIGIIYPPPELRNIVDKTAIFVARNGPEFETRIRQNEINNKKFNFLNPGDPYNAYYNHKVKEYKEGKGVSEPAPTAPAAPKPTSTVPAEVAKAVETVSIPREPPAEFEFTADPPSISAINLDVVKLTAQFVARNGRQFLTNLMNREQRNFHFDFLRPEHSLFTYFTKLLEQYTKILIPPKDLMNKLKKESENPKVVLDQVRSRVEWIKHQEAIRRREEEEAERERVQYAQIDWHDFVVVETVDYQPNEQGLFPPPTTPTDVGSRVLALERFDETAEVGEGDDIEMEVDSEEEGGAGGETETNAQVSQPSVSKENAKEKQAPKESEKESDEEEEETVQPERVPSPPPLPPKEAPPLPPPLPPQPDHVVIRKDYNPKAAAKPAAPAAPGQFLVSPITGEKIPAEKMQEHMRIGLLDPRWLEQRDKALQEKVAQEEVYAIGSSIESSLKQFAERRSDIFGIGVEETAIGKKIGEEDKKGPEKVTWDGHTASVEAATIKARANITIEEQIQQIHKIQGLLPDEEKERIGPSKPTPTSSGGGPPLPPSSLPHQPPPPPPPPASTSAPPTSISAPPTKTQPPPPPPLPPAQPPMPPRTSTMAPPLPPGIPGIIPAPPIMGPPQGILLPPPMLAVGARPGLAHPFGPPIVPLAMQEKVEDEPFAKRMKQEEALIPEAEFLRAHKSPVTFHVQIPNIMEKAEWKLNGQVLMLTLPLTDMVSVIKAKIHEEVGMPPGKQKLLFDGMFIKDSNSLAYYNIGPGATIFLQLKERGGRKK